MKENHLDGGLIQAFLDDQLASTEREWVDSHLANCAACADLLQAQQEQSGRVRQRLDLIQPVSRSLPASQAQALFQSYARQKEMENQTMNKYNFRRYRTAWIAAVLVLILAVAFVFPPVRAIANSFLGLFRVQQITLVQVSQELPERLTQSTQMEMLFSENLQYEQEGDVLTVDGATEASKLAGFAVRLPQGIEDKLEIQVTPRSQIKFTVDLEKLHAVLDEMGRSDLRLPQAVDGAEMIADIERGVSVSFGPCIEIQGDPDDPNTKYVEDCTTLLQIPSPSVETPAGLDVERIGEVYMQFLGMSPEEARAFSQGIDWSTTLVVPIPSYEVDYQQVAVDGVLGTFLSSNSGRATKNYMLFWVKDGLVYALNGEGELNDALAVADSLK